MVDKRAVGIAGVPFVMDVERGKIREFARAVCSDHPDHFRGPSPVIPPTFLASMFHWESGVEGSNPWPHVAMSDSRGMLVEQEYTFHGPPPCAGTQLTACSRIESIEEKTGKRGNPLVVAVMVTEFRDERGHLVAEARMTGVESEDPGDGGTGAGGGETPGGEGPHGPDVPPGPGGGGVAPEHAP